MEEKAFVGHNLRGFTDHKQIVARLPRAEEQGLDEIHPDAWRFEILFRAFTTCVRMVLAYQCTEYVAMKARGIQYPGIKLAHKMVRRAIGREAAIVEDATQVLRLTLKQDSQQNEISR
jgi:hypothetical protein